jgi:hypothetical protein
VGRNWLDRAGVPIVGSDRLTIAARTTGGQPVAPPQASTTTAATTAPATTLGDAAAPAPATTLGDAAAPAPATTLGDAAAPAPATTLGDAVAPDAGAPVGETGVLGGPGPETLAPAGGPEPSPFEFEVVRAAGADARIEGADLNALGRDAFVDVADVVGEPTRARVPALLGLAFVAVAFVAALVSFDPPARDADRARGELRLAGVDVTRQQSVHVALDDDVPVEVRGGLGAFADQAALRLSAADVPLTELKGRIERGRGTLDAGTARYVASGSLAGRLEVRAQGEVLASEEFGVVVKGPWYTTAFGIGSLLVVLAGVAYYESSVRPLRRGRRRVMPLAGCAISAAVVGVGVAALVTALGHATPTVAGVALVAGCSGAAGLFFAVALRRRALRRSIRRAVRTAERSYAR